MNDEDDTKRPPQAVLPVEVASIRLALSARAAQEILGPSPIVPVPAPSALVPGVVAWRGRPVAVLDLGAALTDLPRLEPGAPRVRTVVASTDRGMVALPVDAVQEVRSVSDDRMRPAKVTRGAEREVSLDDTWMPLVDLDRLMDEHLPGRGGR